MAKRRTHEEFVTQATKIHGGKYCYSLSKYINEYTKIIIICPDHGEFEQKPSVHLKGHGCKKCRYEKLSADMGGGLAGFIKKANKIHNDKYDYSKSVYLTSQKKITIICPEHGEFEQLPCNHINKGAGCLKCSSAHQPTNEEFVDSLIKKFGNKHNYAKTKYKSAHDKITVICPDHGEFQVVATSYLRSGSCPKCSASSEQYLISEYIKSIGFDPLINDKNTIKPLELDIYIPEKKLAIEYNGNYWHSYNTIESNNEKARHKNKSDRCEDANIKLLQISTDDLEKFEIIKSMIRHKLNLSKKIGARKTSIKKLSNKASKEFLERCHISGHRNAAVNYGLIYNDKIVAVATFSKHKLGWEIIRYANELNTTVQGGFGKILKHFIKEIRPKAVITFADRRYGNGKVYEQSGFKLIKQTKPGYVYLDSNAKYAGSRIKFQKHKLGKILDVFHSELTEAENMFLNGYRRMWDAGHNQFILIP